ncbi:hypothetical protein [Alkalimarinus alittae]|uniref:DUF2946 domain-containing protein n=1 Tax=Alkalimarinus alittae TaxID=2961619 RepID=A0ABY6MXG4_9ALTE|nr:hypothetical protein [Alkalimarinus alittae]UZE94487.1 hypothetical protein NKI27_10320 [Alkalimarinus alittae]
MIERQAKLILHILILMMLLASSSQFAVAESFDSSNQVLAAENSSGTFNQAYHDSHLQKQSIDQNSNVSPSSINHCPDNKSLLHCGGCMLCAAVFTLMPEKIEVGSIYQSYYIDRFFFAYLDKEIRPPRI